MEDLANITTLYNLYTISKLVQTPPNWYSILHALKMFFEQLPEFSYIIQSISPIIIPLGMKFPGFQPLSGFWNSSTSQILGNYFYRTGKIFWTTVIQALKVFGTNYRVSFCLKIVVRTKQCPQKHSIIPLWDAKDREKFNN